MIIKEADDKASQVAILQALAARPDASPDIRKRIDLEIRKLHAGIQGEKEAAYEIDFHFGQSKNYAVIHDLRIECKGRVAQIDHLLIGRFLGIWVCETKHFSGGIAINEQGECTGFHNSQPYGIASPFEQNRKHIMVLEDLLKTDVVQPPKRMGFLIKPSMTGIVLVSKNARISRPKRKIAGVESIIKSDQFRSHVDRANDRENNPLMMAKVIGSDTLETFARNIVAQHRPIIFNWAAKFGLPEHVPSDIAQAADQARYAPPPLPPPLPAPMSRGDGRSARVREEPTKTKKKLICATCSKPVDFVVARFCWLNKSRFGEHIYCRECQQAVR